MQIQSIREEIHRIVDSLDESGLRNMYNELQENKKVIGYRPNGDEILLGELKDNIRKSREEIANGNFIDIDDLEKESENW
jgi:ketol-acid reductoisomerase